MTAPVDGDVRSRISRDGLDETLFVEAGAGTGKTSKLVDRIANLVLDRGVALDHVAAITFTEAAAAELQSRIRVRFEIEAATAVVAGDHGRAQRCRSALAEADMAAISTLHGFASRILGEFAVAAGLPPRVRVLDEISSQLAHEARWDRFVDALYDDPANERLLTLAALTGVDLEPRYQGHSTLKDVAAEFNQNWDRVVAIIDEEPPPVGTIDFGPFDAAVAAVEALPVQCSDHDDKFYVHLMGVIPQMQAVRAVEDPERKLRMLRGREWKRGSGGKKGAWGGGDVKELRGLIVAVNDAAADVVGNVADAVLRHLIRAIAREVVAAATERRADGGLEFHDLLVLAREMLRRGSDARRALHDRYRHLLLDEFQDTDPIQIELAMLIAASNADDQVPEHWRDLAVDDGRLFFVGDPKQSIYRFRRADIALFLEARDRFGTGDRWVQLVSNFRTVAPILTWVNALFLHEMPEEQAGKQPRYEPLSAYRDPSPDADHRPVLLGGCHADPKISADRLREHEAASVRRIVAEIVERPDSWPVQDQRTRDWRAARLSDVTILVPARTSVPFLRSALELSGIPYRLASGTLVYATQEVRDALAVVRAVDDPTDALSLVAALRSPLYACSDVDLFTYKNAGGHWDLRRQPTVELHADHPVLVALAHLRSLWTDRWWLGPARLLERLLRERQAHLLAFGDPRPTEVWQRLRFLVDQARHFEESGGGADLRSFLEWAELQGADGARVHEPLLPDTDEDAVKIMTIHGSKGLEFPITILSGMTARAGNRRSGVSVLWGESGPPEVSLRKGVATANHEPRADLEADMDSHEKLRLLYVATTRARDHLVVSCHHKAPSKNGSASDTYGGRIWTFFQERTDLFRHVAAPDVGADVEEADPRATTDAGPAPQPTPALAPPTGHGPAADTQQLDLFATRQADMERDEWMAEREALIGPQRRSRVVSATAIAQEALGKGAQVDAGDSDAPDPASLDEGGALLPRRRGRAGTAIGRAVHATLQVLDLTAPRDVTAQVRRQCELEAVPDHAETVERLVRSALGSETIGQAAALPHHKELFVSAPIGSRVIEGYVDLLVESPEGLVVVDYKTDTVADEGAIDAKLATYELQGASYAAAIEEVTGQPVIDCRFVFCASGGAIERSVADLPEAVRRVRAQLEGAVVEASGAAPS